MHVYVMAHRAESAAALSGVALLRSRPPVRFSALLRLTWAFTLPGVPEKRTKAGLPLRLGAFGRLAALSALCAIPALCRPEGSA